MYFGFPSNLNFVFSEYRLLELLKINKVKVISYDPGAQESRNQKSLREKVNKDVFAERHASYFEASS